MSEPVRPSLPGLYIHVPFCTSVCPYCDFAVLIAGEDRRRPFPEMLRQEMELYGQLDLEFDTVYLGGGTPSTLETAQLAAILEAARASLRIAHDAWIALEVNPEDVSAGRATEWRGLGIDMVSVGAQSFDDRSLRVLGRRHDRRAAINALDRLKAVGFQTVSADLIFGVPGQGIDDWRRQLELAIALEVDHLSCYQLTIHEGTIYGRRRALGELQEMAEDGQAELFLLTHEMLSTAGLEAYEVSNFAAAARHRSRHNLKYWNRTPYLGLGPSAHSFVAGRRWWNRRKLRLWQRALAGGESPIEGCETLTREQELLEIVMLGLRTPTGIDLEGLRKEYGLDLEAVNHTRLERFVESGFLQVGEGRLRPTVRGLCVAEALASELELI